MLTLLFGRRISNPISVTTASPTNAPRAKPTLTISALELCVW